MRRHLTYANVVSTLCLFLLFGGVAYAGTQLTKGSVGTNALKAEAVTKGKLHPNSVNSKKVVDNSLTGSDIQAGTLGKVPNAEFANSATHATNAENSINAERLDGRTPAEFGAVLVSGTETELALEAELYFSVSGVVKKQTSFSAVALTMPGHFFRASDLLVRFESAVQATASVHISLVVNGNAQEVCSVTVVPSTCGPAGSIEIPPGAQLAWKVTSSAPVEARPQFALRLAPAA
jgi:hypothetical protein